MPHEWLQFHDIENRRLRQFAAMEEHKKRIQRLSSQLWSESDEELELPNQIYTNMGIKADINMGITTDNRGPELNVVVHK